MSGTIKIERTTEAPVLEPAKQILWNAAALAKAAQP